MAITIIDGSSWLLELEFDNPPSNFWEVENPPADWLSLIELIHPGSCSHPHRRVWNLAFQNHLFAERFCPVSKVDGSTT